MYVTVDNQIIHSGNAAPFDFLGRYGIHLETSLSTYMRT
jgi:hypothetical protein